MTDQPAECGPACTEQHTYQLSICALACTERHGGVADPSWAAPCPNCKATADRPCIRWDGNPASVACQKRWDLLDQRTVAAKQPEPIRPKAGATLRDLALDAAARAAKAGRYWVPTDAQELIVDAVLAVLTGREEERSQAAMLADAFEVPLHLIHTSQPVEHCGNQLPPMVGDGPVTECVLRPGHHGSHANETGTRWIETPTTALDTADGQPALDRILADAEHHEACARLSKTPEGAISHSSIAAGLRIAIEHVKAGHDAEVAQLRQRLEAAATDRRASRESERILQQQIDAQAKEIDRLRDALAEARMWARHGYELGQINCTWSDHGVAPAWLTAEAPGPERPTRG